MLGLVGSTLVPNPTGGGSNPGEDMDPPNDPFPESSFFAQAKYLGNVLSHVRTAKQAYLKVHGGPAPQCAPSSRPVANRGGDGAGRPHEQLLFLVYR